MQSKISTQKLLPYGDDDGCGDTHYAFIILFNYSLVNQMRVKPNTHTHHKRTAVYHTSYIEIQQQTETVVRCLMFV